MSDFGGKRVRISPGDSSSINKKSQPSQDIDMDPTNFKMLMSSLLDEKLAPLATKNDLTALQNEIIALREENAGLWEEVRALQAVTKVTHRRVEELEIATRSCNLIFKGLKTGKEEKNCDLVVKDFCAGVLKVPIPMERLLVRPLGQISNPNKPLLVTFSHQRDRLDVLRSCTVLKGTGFTVHMDLPESARRKRGKLLLVKREIHRLNSNIRVRILPSSLRIGDVLYEWCTEEGLGSSRKPAGEKLSAVVGVNLALLLDSLKKGISASPPSASSKKP